MPIFNVNVHDMSLYFANIDRYKRYEENISYKTIVLGNIEIPLY